MPYNPSAIYDLLRDAFGDDEFRDLCYDHFRLVYEQFTAGMMRSQHIQLLIEACARDQQFDRLLALVETHTPAQYIKYAPFVQDLTYRSIDPLAPQRRDFYAQESLPLHYVSRSGLLSQARDMLLTGHTDIALHGMGGLGKTVLARALCDDPAIQNTFYGGILWAKLSQNVTEEDLKAKLADWVRTLGGTISETAPSLDRLKQLLHELTKNRACLLVVDNVWQRRHLEVFRVDTPDSRLLVTTRDADIAHPLGIEPFSLPSMQDSEAISLLEAWAGPVHWLDDDAKSRVVRRLGYHPLAIKLAGSQLQDYDSPEAWLAEFKATELEAMSIEEIHDSLNQTFALSLNKLDDNQRCLYNALAIFRSDEAIPFIAIKRLWAALQNMKLSQSRKLMRQFAGRALLEVQDNQVILHDLLREFMADEQDEAEVASVHTVLLDAYRQTQTGDGWSTADDDGYLYDHLAYHLDAVADHVPTAAAELKQLFADDAWLHARVPQSRYEYDGYIADLILAWTRAHDECLRQIDAGQPPTALVDCVRYALIRTSLNSLAANYVPELVARAVEVGLWTPERAMSVTAKIPGVEKQAKMYTILAAQLSGDVKISALVKAVKTIRKIKQEKYRAEVLVELIPQLADDSLIDRLVAIRKIKDDSLRAKGLIVLASKMRGIEKHQLLTECLKLIPRINNKVQQTEMLAALASQFRGEARQLTLSHALKITRTIENEWGRAEALACLSPYLGETLLEEQLTLVRSIAFSTELRLKALTTILIELNETKKQNILLEELEMNYAFGFELYQAGLQIWLLSGDDKNKILIKLLDELQRAHNSAYIASMLVVLAPHLTDASLIQQGLQAVQRIMDYEYRAEAIEAMIKYLDEASKRNILTKELTTARTVDRSRPYQKWLLAKLASQMPEQLLEQELEAAKVIGYEDYSLEVLVNIEFQLSGTEVSKKMARTALSVSRRFGKSLGMRLPYNQDPGVNNAFNNIANNLLNRSTERIQEETIWHLWNLQIKERKFIFQTLSIQDLFGQIVLDLQEEKAAEIAESVVDICQEWRWL